LQAVLQPVDIHDSFKESFSAADQAQDDENRESFAEPGVFSYAPLCTFLPSGGTFPALDAGFGGKTGDRMIGASDDLRIL
jgi:hypothetical protein